MRFRSSLLLLALVSLIGGCTSFDDELSQQVFDEIIASRLDALAWAAAWRSFVFGTLGVLLGIGLFVGLRSRELLRLNWQHAKWVRALAAFLIISAAGSTGAWWGFWTGSMRGAEAIVREGQLGTEVLPAAGAAGSMLVAAVYVGSELTDGAQLPDENQLAARVATFGKGEWSMDLEQLEQRLANVRAQTLGIGTEIAKRQVFELYPQLEGTLADKLIPWALDKLTAKVVEKAVEVAENDTAAMFLVPAQEVLTSLDDAAEREGEPKLLSHTELSTHVVEVGMVPMIMGPIEHIARGQRKTGVIAFVLLVLFIVGSIRLADYLIERRASRATTPTA